MKIEDLLLQTLHFEVSTVTTHTFLLHYLKIAEVDEITEDLARVRNSTNDEINIHYVTYLKVSINNSFISINFTFYVEDLKAPRFSVGFLLCHYFRINEQY